MRDFVNPYDPYNLYCPYNPYKSALSLKNLKKNSLFSRKQYTLLITRYFAESRNFQTAINQHVTKWVIIANYFVAENIRKKNSNAAQNRLNR